MRTGIKVALLVLGALAIIGCVNFFKLADLRPENIANQSNVAKAKQLMQEMGEAHQIHLWDSIETYHVIFEDEFYGFLGKQGSPFKEHKTKFSLNYIPGDFNGQMEIVEGKEQGKAWGYQAGNMYRLSEDGKAIAEENDNMKFWIPTYQYFIEFPRRIQEATVVDYIGSNVIEGIDVEGIMASWNSLEPQKDIDQYIIWIDASTKRIVKAEYTIREIMGFISGAAFFTEYNEFHGIPVPTKFPVVSSMQKGNLHEMRILEFSANKKSKEDLLPLDL